MTEEEYQQKILEHEETIKKLNEENTTFKTTLETNKTDLELLNTRIQELKDHNRSLFLKITTPDTPPETEKKKDPVKPILDTVVNSLLTKD